MKIKYKVVEADWLGGERVEKDIGCAWKDIRAATCEMKELSQKFPGKIYSIQKGKS